MYSIALALVCGIGVGVLLMDSLHEKAKPEASRPVPQQAVLGSPIMKPDATVQQCTTSYKCGNEKRYYREMTR